MLIETPATTPNEAGWPQRWVIAGLCRRSADQGWMGWVFVGPGSVSAGVTEPDEPAAELDADVSELDGVTPEPDAVDASPFAEDASCPAPP